MTLQELLDSAKCGPGQLPATNGFHFPPTIELPPLLHAYLMSKWSESEQKREEIGGNLRLDERDRLFSPPPFNAVRSNSTSVRPRSASAPPDLSHAAQFTPIDVTDGQGGNSVTILSRNDSNVVANFHTHPSTPGGTNLQKCGYQPPSIEDVLAMGEQVEQQRDIFVSFVVAHTDDLYAIVYVRGISQFGTASQEKVYYFSGSLQEKGKRIKFPTDKHEEEYFSQLMKNPGGKDTMNKNLELKTNYGQKFSELVLDHLNQVCHVLSLGLYRGDGTILRLQNY